MIIKITTTLNSGHLREVDIVIRVIDVLLKVTVLIKISALANPILNPKSLLAIYTLLVRVTSSCAHQLLLDPLLFYASWCTSHTQILFTLFNE